MFPMSTQPKPLFCFQERRICMFRNVNQIVEEQPQIRAVQKEFTKTSHVISGMAQKAIGDWL